MRVANIRSWRTTPGGSRVEADVDGEPLWFVSHDAVLTASAEAFASALLIPAAIRGEPLEIESPVDRLWIERAPAIVRQVKEWWQVPGTEVIATDVVDAPRVQPGAIAHCFTGGVDSFYALLHAETPPAILVYAHGFDIELEDRIRLDAFLPGFRETAATFGARVVLIATNLRSHNASRCINQKKRHDDWKKSHGGALAALGHLLSDQVERLVIPSSYPYHDPHPWGSHWDLDHLWASQRLTLEHADATLRRDGKVRAIADHVLVQRNLRVCWQTRTPSGNCSRCEKCVRTMIALAMCGRLGDCETFDRTRPLQRLVDDLPLLQPHQISVYEELLRGINDPLLSAAVKRLIGNSRGLARVMIGAVRRWRRSPWPIRYLKTLVRGVPPTRKKPC
jgi:hypothetical protein